MQELLQQNLQLQLQSELSCKQLGLQQQLSAELTTQLGAAESQLQQAQQQQLTLLAELQQQQLQLELRVAAASEKANGSAAAAEADEDGTGDETQQLRDQLLVAELAAADKDKLIRELTLQWREAADQVEDLQQQIKQQDKHHMRLLRASGESQANRLAVVMQQLQQRLQQAEAVMQEVDDATAAAVVASEQQRCLVEGSMAQQRQQHGQRVLELEQHIADLQHQLQQLQQQGRPALQQQQQKLTAVCVQVRYCLGLHHTGTTPCCYACSL